MTTRWTPSLCLVALLAAPAWAQENGEEPAELVLPNEDASIKTLREKLARIGAGLTAGVPLSEIEEFRQLDRERASSIEGIHQILMTLASPEDQKIAVVQVLEAWKDPSSVYPLLLVLDDYSEDYRVRYEIIQRIASFDDERAVIPLTNVLSGKEPRFHAPAAKSLARFGSNERAQRTYPQLLVHADPSTRGWSARSLAWSGWSEGTQLLLEAAERESEPSALAQILFALAEAGVEEGLGRVIAGVRHPNERVRGKACEALGVYGAKAGAEGLAALVGRLDDKAEAEGVRGTAAWVLWRVAPESDEAGLALVRWMGSESEMLDNSCKSALQYMASQKTVDRLVEVLGDGAEMPRRRLAAQALLRLILGVDFGDKAQAWNEWWKSNRDRFAFPRAAANQKREREDHR